jgi:hypothetical protein
MTHNLGYYGCDAICRSSCLRCPCGVKPRGFSSACINQGLPPELRERFILLKARHEDKSITDAEYEDLSCLSVRAAELQAERIAAMAELAKLRGVSLPELMNQLGIQFPDKV